MSAVDISLLMLAFSATTTMLTFSAIKVHDWYNRSQIYNGFKRLVSEEAQVFLDLGMKYCMDKMLFNVTNTSGLTDTSRLADTSGLTAKEINEICVFLKSFTKVHLSEEARSRILEFTKTFSGRDKLPFLEKLESIWPLSRDKVDETTSGQPLRTDDESDDNYRTRVKQWLNGKRTVASSSEED